MKVLYVTGVGTDGPDATTEQLARLSPDLRITTVSGPAEALRETRAGGDFRALLTSPWLSHNDTLSLIVSLRRDRVPIAIVPVLTEAQRDFFASAVAAGADDVLLLKGDTLLRANETLTRIRQSPHLSMGRERRRLRLLYAGSDDRVWTLLEQVPFVAPERATVGPDGSCPVRQPGSETSDLRCDAVVIDQPPGGAHPLQVLKSVKSQASDLPVILLAPAGAADVETAALDLGADDTVIKSGIYRRRLIATLRRVHQRFEIVAQHQALRAREARLRKIVESLPQGVGVISEDFSVLAMNAAALALFGAARPTDVVGRDFRTFVLDAERGDAAGALRRTSSGEPTTARFHITMAGQAPVLIEMAGVPLERDARGSRGTVAVFRVPEAGAPAAAAGPVDTAALEAASEAASEAVAEAERRMQEAQQRAVEAERREAEADALLSAERSEWEAARRALEARLSDTEADAARRGEAESDLADVLTQERSAWDETRRQLETRVAEAKAEAAAATTARQGLERDLEEARAALRDADASGAALRQMQDELARLRETQASDFDDARRRHDAEVADLRRAHGLELADLHRSHEAGTVEARAAGDRTLAERDRAFEAERELWAQERSDLGHAANAARELRQRMESTLREAGEARAELETRIRAIEQARAEQDRIRIELESRLGDALAGREALELELEQLRTSMPDAAQHSAELDALRGRLEETERTATGTRDELVRLQDAVRAADAERHALESRLRDAQAHAGRVEGDLNGAHERIRQLEGELHGTHERIRQLEGDLHGAHERIRQLEGELHGTHERIRQLEGELHGTHERVRQLEGDLHASNERIRALEASQYDVQQGRSSLEVELHDIRSARDTAERDLAAAREQIATLEAQVFDARDRRHALESELADAQGHRLSLEKQLRESHEQVLAVEQRLREVQADRDGTTERLRDLETRLREQEQHSTGTREDADRLRGELDRARADAERQQADWAAARQTLEQRVEDAERLREELERAIDARGSREADQEAARLALQAELRQLAADHAAERGTWEALRQEFERRVHEEQARVQDLESTLESAHRERDAAEQAADAARRAAADAAQAVDARVTQAEAARREAERRLTEATTAQQAAAQRTGAAQAERDAARDELRALRIDHDRLRDALDAERRARESDRAEVEVVRQSFDHERSRRAALRDELRDVQRDADLKRAALDAELAARRALEQQVADADRAHAARIAELDGRIRALTLELDHARASRSRAADSPLFGRALVSRDGRLVECNETFARLFGYADAADALARQASQPIPGFGQPVVDTRRGATGKPRVQDVAVTRLDGLPLRLRVSDTPVIGPDGSDLIERIVVDSTAAQRLEDQLRQARRLEEVGSLAASMTPDIEARLLALGEASRRLADAMPEADPRRQSIDAVRTSLDDALGLVRQLFAFSQRQVRPLESVDLNDAVTRAEPTLRRIVGPQVQFRLDLRESGLVSQSDGDLDQLLTGLVVAARDLLPVGGTIAVETDRVELEPQDLKDLPDGRVGPNTVLAVTATGYGARRGTTTHSVEMLARRCGAAFRVASESDRATALEVYFGA